ncbi:peptidylprolyl isomerase [Candidatus Nitromaritima sp. SCGC AAA799-A02]|nr:peptidylprolyl isomerase [Candidatus Nitromaritima sp. SCGC AAA799-C22]KMP12213.1 peptidylprolyl isomerase [Candidatus Nitromaritima sp. SCGC AAA799-A02]
MIAKDTVVSLNYNLKDAEGRELDRSDADHPLRYLHGAGEIVPGLEKALDGLKVGDKKEVTVTAQEGYGEIFPDLKMQVKREMFPADQKIEVGMQFMAELANGRKHPFVVMELGEDSINIDGNHPLAGKTLHFSIEVLDIRDATSEELEHGHSHGEGSAHDH